MPSGSFQTFHMHLSIYRKYISTLIYIRLMRSLSFLNDITTYNMGLSFLAGSYLLLIVTYYKYRFVCCGLVAPQVRSEPQM